MKKSIFLHCACLLFAVISFSQPPVKRSVRLKNLGNDSINLSLNEEYYMIEDSCAQIIRYGHLNMKQRFFFGPFKDVSTANPDLVVSQGNYTPEGLKDGAFSSYYLNGNLQAKGSYKANKPDGRWEFYYPDGKPKLTQEIVNNEIKIIDAWNNEGKKIVDNGSGKYTLDLKTILWTGKLNNGKPDGTWKVTRVNDRTNTELATESFKNGQFQKGTGPAGEYTDASRITLFNETELPFINAEKLRISSTPCNGVKKKRIVNAQYREGFSAFNEKIKELVSPYLGKMNLQPLESDLELIGEISAKGNVYFTYLRTFDDNLASGLVRELSKLPLLEPALADGKPVAQKMILTFKFSSGRYQFSYRFLPVKTE